MHLHLHFSDSSHFNAFFIRKNWVMHSLKLTVFISQVQVTSTQISPQLAAAVQQASEQQIQVQVRLFSVLH